MCFVYKMCNLPEFPWINQNFSILKSQKQKNVQIATSKSKKFV